MSLQEQQAEVTGRRARLLRMRGSARPAADNRRGQGRSRTRTFIATAALVLAAAGFTATPASAQIIDGDTFENTDSFPGQDCDGVASRVDSHINGRFMIRQHGSELKAYLFATFNEETVVTNLQTNRFFTTTYNATQVDVRIDLVGGTVYRYTWQQAGTLKVFDETGKIVNVDSGLQRWSELVDTHGNLNLDDDDVLTQLSYVHRGYYSGRNFCDYLEALTTG
jgi:hypothetical protein